MSGPSRADQALRERIKTAIQTAQDSWGQLLYVIPEGVAGMYADAVMRVLTERPYPYEHGADAQAEANRLYPPNHPVDDPDGETGTAQSDPYGYDELGNKAFLEGVAWEHARWMRAVTTLLGEVEE